MNNDVTILQAKSKFLESVTSKRSEKTAKAYNNALETFFNMLAKQELDVSIIPVDQLREVSISDFVSYINALSPSTESLYLQVIKNFFEFLNAENLATINVSQVRMLIRQRTRRPKVQTSDYPEEDIICIINSMQKISENLTSDSDYSKTSLLRDARDSALILTLADTGLRVEEVCKLKVGDMDWRNHRIVLVGRGKKQSLIRFSTRAMSSVRLYLDLRSDLDTRAGTSLTELPLYARHDKGAGKKIQPAYNGQVAQ
jgi:integrase/recombinase XerC